MAGGGFVRLPDGSVIVALSLPVPTGPGSPAGGPGASAGTIPAVGAVGAWPWRQRPAPAEEADPRRWSAHADAAHTVRAAAWRSGGEDWPRVRVLVHAGNRARALTRLRNLGLRAVYLRGNAEPPGPDEVTAVLHHPDGLVWRARPGDDTESWQPIGALLRAA